MSHNPSPEQAAIYLEVQTPGENLIISAVAGSGKTTTLVNLLSHLPATDPGGLLRPSICFLAFNKSIADTLKERVPPHVQCATFHSLGFRALKRVLPDPRNVKVEGQKVPRLVFNKVGKDNPDVRPICSLVARAKSRSPHDDLDWDALSLSLDMDFDDRRRACSVADDVLRLSNQNLTEIDFDDMLYLPIKLGASFDEQDYILVDEAQDTNDIQLEILSRLAKKGNSSSRYIFVGDRFQAIYGFRGANHDSIDRITSRFACKSLPLSVSWRCSAAVVREANRWIERGTSAVAELTIA